MLAKLRSEVVFVFFLSHPPHTTRKEARSVCVLHCFILIINRVIENGFFYKKQDVKYALKDSSLFTLLSRKFYNQFINLYYRYILQAMITSRDATLVEMTILDIYQLVRIPQRKWKIHFYFNGE